MPLMSIRRALTLTSLVLSCIATASTTVRAAAPREPAPRVESSGPVRVARYSTPFAPSANAAARSADAARYYSATPTAYGCYGAYGCGYGYYCGWSCYGIGGWGCYSSVPTTGVAP